MAKWEGNGHLNGQPLRMMESLAAFGPRTCVSRLTSPNNSLLTIWRQTALVPRGPPHIYFLSLLRFFGSFFGLGQMKGASVALRSHIRNISPFSFKTPNCHNFTKSGCPINFGEMWSASSAHRQGGYYLNGRQLLDPPFFFLLSLLHFSLNRLMRDIFGLGQIKGASVTLRSHLKAIEPPPPKKIKKTQKP